MKAGVLVGLLGAETAAAAENAAAAAGVPLPLLAALLYRESGGRPAAGRAEPLYPYLWDVKAWTRFRKLTDAEVRSSSPPIGFSALPGCSRATEWAFQRISWGPAQVMGSTARQLGFRGPFLSELARDVPAAVLLGARFLKILLVRYAGDVDDALSSYNAGRPVDTNAGYVEAIRELAARLEKE